MYKRIGTLMQGDTGPVGWNFGVIAEPHVMHESEARLLRESVQASSGIKNIFRLKFHISFQVGNSDEVFCKSADFVAYFQKKLTRFNNLDHGK